MSFHEIHEIHEIDLLQALTHFCKELIEYGKNNNVKTCTVD